MHIGTKHGWRYRDGWWGSEGPEEGQVLFMRELTGRSENPHVQYAHDVLAGRNPAPLAEAEMRRRNRNRRKAGKPPHRLSWEQEMEMERVLRAAHDLL
jgi:hypothetical protein